MNYPDHCLCPDALGYAMLHGVLSEEEISSVRFDHGETATEFILLAKGLSEKIVRQLQDGKAFFDFSSLSGIDDTCFDHH